MIPNVIELGPLPIRSFGLMVALALFVGAARLALSFARYGIDPRLAERYVTAAGISGLLGARLWHIGENWRELRHDLFGALFASAGFTFYGGFIIAAIFLSLMARRDGTSIARFCDAAGPALALGYAVGRLGCQLSGDGDYGSLSSGFWGMSYSTGVVPTPPGIRVYPTPLFESALSLLIVWVLLFVERSKTILVKPLQRFGLYLALISIERMVVEIFRINPDVLGKFSEAQIIGAALFMIGVLFISPLRNLFRPLSVVVIILPGLIGCGVVHERPKDKPSGLDVVGKPMSSDQAKEVLSTVGGNFAYGSGLGDAALNVGTAVVFPPYALYLVGNAVLSLSGYEPVTVASLLPEEDGKKWSSTYDSLVSGPGKVVAAVAGREYRSQEVADQRLGAVLSDINKKASDVDSKGEVSR
jgi:phosphatidylglycerol:prolipoprotein diacylglycerol transferase